MLLGYMWNIALIYNLHVWRSILVRHFTHITGPQDVFPRLGRKTYITHPKYPCHGRGTCASIVTDIYYFSAMETVGYLCTFGYDWKICSCLSEIPHRFFTVRLHTVYLFVQRCRKPTLINYYDSGGFIEVYLLKAIIKIYNNIIVWKKNYFCHKP